jgi:hypothetical protein
MTMAERHVVYAFSSCRLQKSRQAMELTTDVSLWALIRHAGTWLGNLRRAGKARQGESKTALRGVVVAARRTRAYLRSVEETGRKDHDGEAALSALWSELGFALQDLGLSKLAKRCDITGRYWSDPSTFDEAFLEKADVGLERMERIALGLLADTE